MRYIAPFVVAMARLMATIAKQNALGYLIMKRGLVRDGNALI